MATAPDPLWNTVFAVATGVLDISQMEREQRIRIKRTCMAYAAAKGVNLQMFNFVRPHDELWVLESSQPFTDSFERGTLQQCCLKMIEMFPQKRSRQDRMALAVEQGLTDWLHAPGYVDRQEREELKRKKALTT